MLRTTSFPVVSAICVLLNLGSEPTSARQTELSLSDLNFRATHNSYEGKAHTITEQIDDYDVWCIELDLCGFEDDNNANPIRVSHGSSHTEGTFSQFLIDVTSSSQWRNRVIFLWMDIKNDGPCKWGAHGEDSYGNVLIIEDRISKALEASSFFANQNLGVANVYTHSDWLADGKTWPSVEELIRRGKHFICIYDENSYDIYDEGDYAPPAGHVPLLFATAQNNGEKHAATGFINTKDNGDGNFPNQDRPLAAQDPQVGQSQFLWRSYDLNSASEFSKGVATGRNLLATDHYTENWSYTGTAHSYLQAVTNLHDHGLGSLRSAIANLDPVHGHIIFYNSHNGGTIKLQSPLVVDGKTVTMDPANLPAGLTLDGQGLTRIFEVRNGGRLEISNCAIENGLSTSGGAGIFNDGSIVTLERCTLQKHRATGALGVGAAIRATGPAHTTLHRCRLIDNQASSAGGAIWDAGRLVCTDTSFLGNSSDNDGGALFSSGSSTLTRCSFGENTAAEAGGAIYDTGQGETFLVHCSVGGNRARSAAGIRSEGLLSLDSCTVAQNVADVLCGGVELAASSMIIENSIVAGNTAPQDPDLRNAAGAGAILVEGANLIGDNSTVADAFPGGPLAGTPGSPLDPLLAPLADFGGHTEVMMPLPGSPAVEAGTTTHDEDQLMRPIPFGALPDLGAVEARLPHSFTLIDTDGDTIDDRFEPAYGLVVGEDDRVVDTDRDGSTDAEELRNMTNPLNPQDYLRLLSVVKAPGFSPGEPRFVVRAATFPGLSYRFETSSTLAGLFQPQGGLIIAESDTVDREIVLTEGQGFVRVRRLTPQ